MPDAEPIEVGLRITAALDYARSTNDDEVRPHYLRTLQQLTDEVHLSDLTTAELIALKTLLIPIHSRLILGRDPKATTKGNVLRLISPDNATG